MGFLKLSEMAAPKQGTSAVVVLELAIAAEKLWRLPLAQRA